MPFKDKTIHEMMISSGAIVSDKITGQEKQGYMFTEADFASFIEKVLDEQQRELETIDRDLVIEAPYELQKRLKLKDRWQNQG